MKFRDLRAARQPKLMVIPMIDIMFFLLVFFIMSTLYMVEQKTIPVHLPQARNHQVTVDKSVAIAVTADGKVLFEQEELPLSLLRRRIEAALRGDPDLIFILRSDKQTEYGKVVAVLDEMKAAGVKRMAIATERKAE